MSARTLTGLEAMESNKKASLMLLSTKVRNLFPHPASTGTKKEMEGLTYLLVCLISDYLSLFYCNLRFQNDPQNNCTKSQCTDTH